MATRKWQVPDRVARAALLSGAADTTAAERNRDLASGMPVGAATLLAITADASAHPTVVDWATRLYRTAEHASRLSAASTIVAAGLADDGYPDVYGVLDPDYDGERVTAVFLASAGGVQRWDGGGWKDAPEPVGLPVVRLDVEVLADALVACVDGGSLILRPDTPRAWLREPGIVAAAEAAADTDGVYAVADALDTSAVVALFRALPGPAITVRRAGRWVPDDGTLLAQLQSIAPPPVVAVPPDDVADVIRQVDDYDAAHPETAKPDSSGRAKQAEVLTAAAAIAAASNGGDHSRDCMIALPVPVETGSLLSADGAETPIPEMHVTLAYLGDTDALDKDSLTELGRTWAKTVPVPLTGKIGGGGLFTGGDQAVAVALPDIPNLPVAHRNLTEMLDGADVPYSKDHGFTPHITLAWGADDVIHPGNHDLDFPGAALYFGDEVIPLPFSQPQVDLDKDDEPIAASARHDKARREAAKTDAQFDAERATLDLAEQSKRREFESALGKRYDALVSEGTEPGEAAAAVQREIKAEDDRRLLWERERADSLQAERARRLAKQPELYDSKDLSDEEDRNGNGIPDSQEAPEAVTADAVPHTRMPPQLVNYWTHGKGAAKIRWGTHGDYMRAVRALAKYMNVHAAKGAANTLHKLATGTWTGSKHNHK